MRPCPKPEKSDKKSLKQKCIELSGDIATHGRTCKRCGRTYIQDIIDPHHIVSGRSSTIVARTDAQMPLCRHICHRWAHDYPEAFGAWVDTIYPGRREMLKAVVRSGAKNFDWKAVYKGLQDEWADMMSKGKG